MGARDDAIEALEDALDVAEVRISAQRGLIEARDRDLLRFGRRVAQLDAVATWLADRVVQRERELRALRAELENALGKQGPLAALDGELSPPPELGEEAAHGNGYRSQGHGELFEGIVEVEIGPLSDFAQLVGFEDAAGGIGAAADISVKRFTKGRATLAMQLTEPVALLRELEERAPFEFRVRDLRSDRLILDVDDE